MSQNQLIVYKEHGSSLRNMFMRDPKPDVILLMGIDIYPLHRRVISNIKIFEK